MKKSKVEKAHKPTLKERLEAIHARIDVYLTAVNYRQRDDFSITMKPLVDGKEGMFKVSSLLASVLTAQGLGKEIRLEAQPGADGGTLYVRFYNPVSTAPLRHRCEGL
jgi:hypothetical protein